MALTPLGFSQHFTRDSGVRTVLKHCHKQASDFSGVLGNQKSKKSLERDPFLSDLLGFKYKPYNLVLHLCEADDEQNDLLLVLVTIPLFMKRHEDQGSLLKKSLFKAYSFRGLESMIIMAGV